MRTAITNTVILIIMGIALFAGSTQAEPAQREVWESQAFSSGLSGEGARIQVARLLNSLEPSQAARAKVTCASKLCTRLFVFYPTTEWDKPPLHD